MTTEVDWEIKKGKNRRRIPEAPEVSRKRVLTYGGGTLSSTTHRCSRTTEGKHGSVARGTPDLCSHLPTWLHILTKQDENEKLHSRASAPPRHRYICWIKTSCWCLQLSADGAALHEGSGAERQGAVFQSAARQNPQPRQHKGSPGQTSKKGTALGVKEDSLKTLCFPSFSTNNFSGESGDNMVAWRSSLISRRWSENSCPCTLPEWQHFWLTDEARLPLQGCG